MKLNPFICVQLFDAALSRGFSTLDSFLMLNSDAPTLHHAYDVMESMGKYSIQQLEYVSTMLTVKTVHTDLMKSGNLFSMFDIDDKKRYSIIVMQSESDDPILQGQSLHFSEHGLRGYEGMEERTPPDYKPIIATLKEGGHLIRYMNVPYALKYENDMFIPVLLKAGVLADPRQ